MAEFFKRICMATLLAVAGLLAAGEPGHAQTPLKAGDVLTGKVRLVKTRHPNGTPISAYQLVTPAGYLLNDDDLCEKDQVLNKFHLVVMDNKAAEIELKRSVGKTRSVKVVEPMCSHTAWHIGDVVLLKWEFAPVP